LRARIYGKIVHCVTVAKFGLCILALAAAAADASPPPPPPSYVSDVEALITHGAGADTQARLATFLAEDVKAYVNDPSLLRTKQAGCGTSRKHVPALEDF